MMEDHKDKLPENSRKRAGHPDFIFLTKPAASSDTVAAVAEVKSWWGYPTSSMSRLYCRFSANAAGVYPWSDRNVSWELIVRQVSTLFVRQYREVSLLTSIMNP